MWAPKLHSQASPKTWADECQKTFLPSSVSKSKNSKTESPSNGRSKSHNSPLTLEIHCLSKKDLPISCAILNGVVSQA
ncbi:hypothetical protein WICMUC_005266 [Wickerhamomyces mucosus]|uniref:Uncharacterized protein n=1 Tax=Wickerhamomyces mucosus TaxID=1378264 RepID=A0A9P8T7E0_9ASCO|nr:hypothetical protein WICMUC_005266 [Wickerhamomyces mucosus]